MPNTNCYFSSRLKIKNLFILSMLLVYITLNIQNPIIINASSLHIFYECLDYIVCLQYLYKNILNIVINVYVFV